MSKKICFILDWYPTKTNNGCVFAKHLICAIADLGYECTIIAPNVISKAALKKVNKVPYERVEYTEKGSKIQIYTPFYLHCTSRKETMKISMNNHYRAVMKTIRKHGLKPDVVYGHFLYQCGLTAARVGESLGIPAYCACGENSLRLEKGKKPYDTGLKYGNWKERIKKLKGIVSVSNNNITLLRENGFIDEDMKIQAFPNGVDGNHFYQMDKKECRKQLGFPEDAFIVAYTGAFTTNKGVDRLSEALKAHPDVYAIFMGQGPVEPDCKNILWKGRVVNNEVAKYLNAADLFVLPTKGEGCCNAIVEALACGLPVISSDLPFNDDILNEENSLRINVESVGQIREAIKRIKLDKELMKKLTMGAQKSAETLNIETRARRILEFMEL